MKEAVLFLNEPIDGYKIIKVYKNNFSSMMKYLNKNHHIKRVFISEDDITFTRMLKLLSIKKDIRVIRSIETKKLISLLSSVEPG